jgi:hypothetical protein
VEVAARHHITGVGEHHRVVGRAVGFDGHRIAHELEGLSCSAVHLGGAAHRIGVLHLAAVLVRLVDAAAGHQRLDIGRRRPLSGEWAGIVDARFEGMDRPEQRVDRERGGDVGRPRQLLGRRQREGQDRRGGLGAVDQRQPLFGAERDRSQSRTRQRVATLKGSRYEFRRLARV